MEKGAEAAEQLKLNMRQAREESEHQLAEMMAENEHLAGKVRFAVWFIFNLVLSVASRVRVCAIGARGEREA